MTQNAVKNPLNEKCIKLGDHLYNEYKESGDCGELLLEWSKGHFYGRLVQDHIPVFHHLYALLRDGKHFSKNTSVRLGDMDHSVWIEECENSNVIVATNNSICRDDSTLIYIFNPNKFLCRRVWDRQKKSKSTWGDHRDIDIPSLQTYRDYKFDFGYSDARDKGHCFSYDLFFHRVDKPNWHEMEIIIALRDLMYFRDEVKLKE